MSWLMIILLSLLLFYLAGVLLMSFFWRRQPDFVLPEHISHVPLTVVIPVRDEERNIAACLRAISRQQYPAHLLEVIVVDDHSHDKTAQVVMEIEKQYPFSLLLLKLPEEKTGKKKALDMGIRKAKGMLIVTTDADCIMQEEWLAGIAAFHEKTGARMISGPVSYTGEKNWFEKMQSIDFLAMTGFGAAAFSCKMPVIGNGANLCFEREAYLQVEGYEGTYASVSGDDVLLMHKFKRKYPGRIRYLKFSGAMVSTLPSENLRHFFHQKLRWASKARLYKDHASVLISVLLLLINVLTLMAMVALPLVSVELRWALLFLLLVKLGVDLFFLFPFLTFAGKRRLWLFFFPIQLLYPAYITGISIFAPFFNFSWKGRRSNFFH